MSDVLINQIYGLLVFCGLIAMPLYFRQQKIIDNLQKEIKTLKLANTLLEKTLRTENNEVLR